MAQNQYTNSLEHLKHDKNAQQVLKRRDTERVNERYKLRKQQSLELAKVYSHLNYKKTKVERVASCADVLKFFQNPETLDNRLWQAYLCKDKLCSICNYRRSRKFDFQIMQILDKAVKEYPKAQFLFLTLTQKNVEGTNLGQELTKIGKAFKKMQKRKVFTDAVLGFVRGTEVTYNAEKNNFHPHVHVLLMVKPSYFNNNYISQKEWSTLWQQSMGLDYKPIVDVRKVRPAKEIAESDDYVPYEEQMIKAIHEVAKYPIKPTKITIENAQVIDDLATGLYRKRQLGFGGVIAKIRKELALDDIENGDLVNVTNQEETVGRIITAKWLDNQNRYKILDYEQYDPVKAR